ncbi:hypothetical protein [Archangium violaceum]|uniref:Outer membrane protein beta-barrel domain-containing protein n=1 Tax=Archangium violaceum Cb vi76 TaxID=1406225 RepID=A0A084SGE0_9BACT|nr:hypothetical protein [Archangium violaceum]KFA87525.1 hypothetical protein Q664_46685 [Archangium violaceum Cb vi76]
MKQLLRPALGGLLALAVFLSPERAEATDFRLTLGADYQINSGAFFHLTGSVDFIFVGPLSIGTRFGALLATQPNTFGVPLDLNIRFTPRRTPLYVEFLGGPWIFFQGDVFRAHAAFGFGYQGRSVSFGLEVGYLQPSPHIGLRLGWRF